MVLQRVKAFITNAARVISLSLALATSAFATDNALLKATIEMDRQYIPALIYTQIGDQVAAKEAMMSFSTEWTTFATTFAVNSDDPEWQYFVDLASSMVSRAFVDVLEGDFDSGYHNLKAVQTTLQGLRERNDINYYVDALNAYKPFMDALITTADNREGKLFTKAQIKTLQKNWAQVWPRWEAIRHHVSQAKFDQELFDFNDEQFIELKQAVAQEQLALNKLRKALLLGSHRDMAHAAIGLEAGFMRTYRAFGDMP